MAYYNSGNRIQRTSPIVLNLVIINALIFLIQNIVPTTTLDIKSLGSLYYYQSSHFKLYQFITYMFFHENFTHILFNMFVLWTFGTILERFWGGKKFLIFYLICGIGAAIVEQFLTPYDALQLAKITPEYLSGQYSLDAVVSFYKENSGSLGASGAIMGVMAAFAYLFPNTELYIMFIPIPVKAKYVIPVIVLIDLFGGLYRIQGDNVGHWAHLGGAAIGFLLVFFWNKTNRKTFY